MAISLLLGCGGSDDARGSNEVGPRLAPLVNALHASASLHELQEPASEEVFQKVERKLGRRLPHDVRSLYDFSDGMALVEGNLVIEALRTNQEFSGLSDLTSELRARGHQIPPEAVVFGDDGSDSLFALWLPRNRADDDPVPVLELDLGGDGIALVGSDLLSFIRGRIAYYLLLLEAPEAALDALEVPERFRVSPEALGDAEFFGLRAWADPHLPDPHAELYERGTSWAALRRRYGP
jgi:hypothetical protein